MGSATAMTPASAPSIGHVDGGSTIAAQVVGRGVERPRIDAGIGHDAALPITSLSVHNAGNALADRRVEALRVGQM